MKRAAGTVTITILLALGLPAIAAHANPDLTVTPSGGTLTAADLVDALVGPGIETTAEAYSYVSQASGTFSGGTGIIGFESGVLLTSGNVENVVGPNQFDALGTVNEAPGDPDLTVLAGGATTRDASILSFTFVPTDTTGLVPLRVRLRRVQRVRRSRASTTSSASS